MGFPGAYDKTDNGRQVTSKLWRHFNPMAMLAEPGNGFLYFEDFHREIGTYVDGTLTQNGSAGTALTTTQNARCIGALTVAAADTDDGDGPTITWGGLGFTPASGTKVAMEWRFEVSLIATMDLFLGAATLADTAIIAADVLAATDVIGFYIGDEGAGVSFGGIDSGGTVSTVTADVATLEADTQIKLGFLIDGIDSVEIYVNGEGVATTGFAQTGIPDSIIYPKLELRSQSPGAPTLTCDWMRIGFTGQI